MAKILSYDREKRGTIQLKVETSKGEVYIIGFSSDVSTQDYIYYPTVISSIMDDYDKMPEGDLFSFISMQLARAKMEGPLFLMPDRNSERTRIGKKIRSIREEKNMEAKTLARLTDIDPSNLSRIESGKFSAGLDTLCKIAMALDSKVDIIQNKTPRPKGFSMRRNFWALSSGDFLPYAYLPAYDYLYWPVSDNSEIRIGDIVVICYRGEYDYTNCLIVSEERVSKDQMISNFPDDCIPCPTTDADFYMKLNFNFGLTATEATIIINHAKSQIEDEPKEPVLLNVDIL